MDKTRNPCVAQSTYKFKSGLIKCCLLSPQCGLDVCLDFGRQVLQLQGVPFYAKIPRGIGMRYKRDICAVSIAGLQACLLLLIFPTKARLQEMGMRNASSVYWLCC